MIFVALRWLSRCILSRAKLREARLKLIRVLSLAALLAAAAVGQELNCDLSGYKPQDGLKAQIRAGVLELTWQGERREQLRAAFAIRGGQPVVQELAARKNGGTHV